MNLIDSSGLQILTRLLGYKNFCEQEIWAFDLIWKMVLHL